MTEQEIINSLRKMAFKSHPLSMKPDCVDLERAIELIEEHFEQLHKPDVSGSICQCDNPDIAVDPNDKGKFCTKCGQQIYTWEPINYTKIAMSDIDPEARRIAVAWVEGFEKIGGIEIEQKVKLASDIMNFAIAYHKHHSKQNDKAV